MRDLCEDVGVSQSKLGADVSQSLNNRIADLVAAKTIQDLPFLNFELASHVNGEEVEVSKMELSHGYKLFFTPGQRKIPKTKEGSIDWLKLTRIKILSIAKDVK